MKITVKITPNAKCSEITGVVDNVLNIKIKAPPVEGKANEELIRFLAKTWGILQRHITVLHGATSRTKVLEVPDEAKKLLGHLV